MFSLHPKAGGLTEKEKQGKREEQTRRLAQTQWEKAGRPEGRDLEFWFAAERIGLENKKLELEVRAIESPTSWDNTIHRYLPLLTALVAVGGFWFGVLQFFAQLKERETEKSKELAVTIEPNREETRREADDHSGILNYNTSKYPAGGHHRDKPAARGTDSRRGPVLDHILWSSGSSRRCIDREKADCGGRSGSARFRDIYTHNGEPRPKVDRHDDTFASARPCHKRFFRLFVWSRSRKTAG